MIKYITEKVRNRFSTKKPTKNEYFNWKNFLVNRIFVFHNFETFLKFFSHIYKILNFSSPGVNLFFIFLKKLIYTSIDLHIILCWIQEKTKKTLKVANKLCINHKRWFFFSFQIIIVSKNLHLLTWLLEYNILWVCIFHDIIPSFSVQTIYTEKEHFEWPFFQWLLWFLTLSNYLK